MAKNLAEISGKSLADLMGVEPSDYITKYFNNARQNEDLLVRVVGILTIEKKLKLPLGTRKVSKGEYKSGDIWLNNHYNDAYLYVGKRSDGEDVILSLKEDMNKIGRFQVVNINNQEKGDAEDYKIFLDERIFSKY